MKIKLMILMMGLAVHVATIYNFQKMDTVNKEYIKEAKEYIKNLETCIKVLEKRNK